MANGTVTYFNGASGWIKQTNVEDLPTSASNDVLLLFADASGVVALDAAVSFTTASGEPWIAREMVVT